jgi:flagellar protein FlaJ
MSLELLRSNIKEEKKLIERIKLLSEKKEAIKDEKEKRDIDETINATIIQIRILNNSIPKLLENIIIIKKLPTDIEKVEKQINKDIITISHIAGGDNTLIAINKRDKALYLKQLQISESHLKGLKNKKIASEEYNNEFKKPNFYVIISNKLFSKSSNSLIEKYQFENLKISLRKSNFKILLNSYISTILMTAFLSFIFAIILTLFFTFFGFSFTDYTLILNENIIVSLLRVIWIIPVMPLATTLILYLYPSTEKKSIEKNLDYEMPFATIQMAAIAGADIEPSNIFKIIALSKEYPNIRQEAKKLMNQINLYGYDMVTALRNVAMSSPSKSWADLLNGFSTTIRSGGDLSKYLQKRAETLLFEYRLKRERATRSAETFMDIYISVVIAAPMLLMLLLVMISVSKIGINLPIPVLTLIVISIITLINIIFLVFLQVSQRKM